MMVYAVLHKVGFKLVSLVLPKLMETIKTDCEAAVLLVPGCAGQLSTDLVIHMLPATVYQRTCSKITLQHLTDKDELMPLVGLADLDVLPW